VRTHRSKENTQALNPDPPAQLSASPDGVQSHLRLHRAFASRYLPDARDLIVYVPPGYDQQPERTYPVFYMHDGQNLFDGQASFIPGRTWQVREHADAAIEAGEVEPLIIVGIGNTGDRRVAEYTPDRDGPMGGGQAASYGLLLTRELMPWIAARYRVRAGREATGLGGSSLGGLVTLYLGLCYPQHFGRLAVLSPSVWWNRKSILGCLEELAPKIRDKPRLWLDAGDREGAHTLENAEQLSRHLVANDWRPGESLHFERVAGGTHDEASWAMRVRPMLRFLFPAR
jgi:enterochelin esterase-like enzyme